MNTYETVIGLEVHVELKTDSKIFCGCPTEFGAPPNTHVCPICLAHPGVLPVLNEHALELAIKAACALNCAISPVTKFDRKNYFYPDSPKAYQISQFDQPVGLGGYIDIEVGGETRRIGITRVHLEEDAGKSTHAADGSHTLVDFNRVGVPLIEIVSEPDLRTPEEARLYLEKLRSIMQYCEVSDVKMEEGSLRCDANISLRPHGQEQLGTKVELKNMNSFRNVQRGLEYEEIRQARLLNEGGTIIQATLRWDDVKNETIIMRTKEEAHDYRYFPDPDLVEIVLDEPTIARIRATIPELPDQRRVRYIEKLGLPSYDADVLTASKIVSDYFEATLAYTDNAKAASNWIMGELMGHLNASGQEITDSRIQPEQLGKLLALIDKGTISTKIAKTIFEEMFEQGGDPEVIIQAKGLVQISDEGAIAGIVDEVIAANTQSVADYQAGKEKALGALVGQVMKATKGKANPQVVNKLILERLQR